MMEDDDVAADLDGLAAELEDTLASMAGVLFSAASVSATLQPIVELAADTIVGCDHAGILVLRDGRGTTTASTGPGRGRARPPAVRAGEVPCLDAASELGRTRTVSRWWCGRRCGRAAKRRRPARGHVRR